MIKDQMDQAFNSQVLTGNKDADLLIMKHLDDHDLLNICLIKNRYIQDLCHVETFWRNIYMQKFGQDAFRYKPQTRSWRNHYMKTIIILEDYKQKPWEFLERIYWSPLGLERSFYMSPISGKKIPFIETGEDVMIPFFLLDLGELADNIIPSPAKRNPYNYFKYLTFLFNNRFGQNTNRGYINVIYNDRYKEYRPEIHFYL
jgi:hypothetical protein